MKKAREIQMVHKVKKMGSKLKLPYKGLLDFEAADGADVLGKKARDRA